eukprot:scaffold12043_cov20-Tisochrysis_lutea.AAC.4
MEFPACLLLPVRSSHMHCLQVSNDAGLSSDPQSVTRILFVAAKCGSGMASCDNGECVEGEAKQPCSVHVCVLHAFQCPLSGPEVESGDMSAKPAIRLLEVPGVHTIKERERGGEGESLTRGHHCAETLAAACSPVCVYVCVRARVCVSVRAAMPCKMKLY